MGYDLASGLGSMDVNALVANWGGTVVSPIAVTACDPLSTLAGQPVSLSATATGGVSGAPLTFNWNFGDGSTGTGPHVSHTYQASAATTFAATVTVTDGTTTSQPQVVAVMVTPINVALAAITQPALGTMAFPGSPLTFSGATLGQWPGGTAGLTYSWNFGDGQTATGATTTHSFSYNANAPETPFTVTLTIADGVGHSASTSVKVYANYDLMLQAYNPAKNNNWALDARDLLMLAGEWGTPGTVNGTARNLQVSGDLNGDGKVDDADLALWINTFPQVAQ